MFLRLGGKGYLNQSVNDKAVSTSRTAPATSGLVNTLTCCVKGTVPQNIFSLKRGHIGGIDL